MFEKSLVFGREAGEVGAMSTTVRAAWSALVTW